jgi:hypothetical protein
MMEQQGIVAIRKGLTPGDVHINRPLTNISVAYMQDPGMFIASRIFPSVPVQKQSDIFIRYNRADWNRNEMKKRAPATESAGGTYGADTDNYYAHVYAVHRDVDDQLRANADEAFNIDRDATEWVSRKGLIFREISFAENYFKTGVWTNQKTGVPTAPTANQFLQWNDAASEPVKNVKTWKDEMLQATSIVPNVLVLGHLAYTALTENDSIIDRIKYGQTPGSPAIVTKQALAALFEIDRIEVLSAIVNTGPEGGVESNSFIAQAKSAALFYAPSSPGLMTPSAGYTFVWTGYLGASAEGGRVSQFRMDLLKSDRFELELAFSQKVVAPDLGIFASAVIA